MATYTVTTANWNSSSFWSTVSRNNAGHTLDFSSLGPGYSVVYDTGSGLLTLSNGTTTYTVADRTYSGPTDAALGGNSRFENYTTVRLPAGSDSYFGSDRAENVSLGGGNDTIFTGDGTDTVTGIDGNDFVNLGAGNESVSATGGNNTIMGGEGNDTLSSAGNDELQGGSGNDVLSAAAGNNTIDGGTGADSITTGAGNDMIAGGSGQDTISSGGGNDTIFGDAADIGVNAGTLSSFDFTSIGETGNTGTGVIGSYAVYDNIGVTDQGVVVQARLTILDAENPNMQVEFNNNSVYLNRDGAADSGTGVTLGFEFFDQATGAPIKITGVFTFMDIDTSAESVTAQTADVQSLSVSSNPSTDLSTSDNGEEIGANSDYSSSGNADQDHWAQFAYSEQQMLVFEVTTRSVGTNYSFSTNGFSNPPTVITATPEPQHDLIDAGAGDDLVYGMAGNDTIIGGTGRDTIDGGTGNDSIDGGADADVIRVGDRFGSDIIRGGEAVTTGTDYDVLDFSGMTSGISVTMTGHEAGTATNGTDTLTYSQIEGYVLTNQADSFDGQYGPSTSGVTVQGGAGDDSIVGTQSADLIDGGADNDTMRGGMGNDTITGGSGNDSIHGNEGNDSLSGGDGADTIYGEDGDDSVEGGAGDDHLEGNAGDDTLVGGAGNDWLRGSFGEDALYGGTGDDYLWGGYGDDTFHIENGFGNDTVDAEAEDETTGDVLDLSAVTDALTVDLSSSNPEIGTVTDGTGTLQFNDIEIIVLGAGTDTLVLADGSGADSVTGFAAPTDMGGGTWAGNDRLDVSGMTDALGSPVNVADVTVTDTVGDGSGDAVLTFPNGETLTLIGVSAAQVSSPAQLIAMGIPPVPSDDIVTGTSGADLIDTAYTGDPEGDRIDNLDNATLDNDDVVYAGGGDDTIDAGAGDDTIYGEAGDDEIFVDTALDNDSILGGETGETQGDRINLSSIADDLTITFTGPETGTITDGTNTAHFAEIERFQLGTGNDSVIGSDGAEHIIGNAGNDTILGGGGNDTVFSGLDDDSLSGGAGNDSLVAGSGADTVDGGSGDDTIDLGAADGDRDVLVLADGSGSDVVSSFETPTDLGGGAYSGNDQLDVSALTDLSGNPVSTEDVTVTDTNGDGTGHAILTFPNGEQITLVGVTVGEVQSPAQLNAMGIPLAPGDFIVEGTGADDLIDTAYGGDPNGDFVDNGDGIGGSQDDTILANGGNDTVLAGGGNDSVEGGAGDDLLDGGVGDDTLRGGDGNDRFVASTGNNLLDGGADADLFEVGHGTDTIIGGETGTDDDTLSIAGANDAIDIVFTGDEQGTYTDDDGDSGVFSEIESFVLSAGNDAVDASVDSSGITVLAGAGNDTLIGGSGNDTLFGEDGADSLTGGIGADALDGGEGDDTLHVGSGDAASGGGGDDHFYANAADMNGADLTITGGETGETAGDTLTITGPANITMTGAESGTVTWLDGSTLTFSEIENVNYIPCFTPGTLIKSVRGEVDAADIRRGDRVLTRDNGYKRVLWAGSRTLSAADLIANPALQPVLIRAGALGRRTPERDMMVSPRHRVVMGGAAVELLFGEDEVLVAAGHLVGRAGITRVCPPEGVTYVHFMFDTHELVLSDGAWTESFQPGDLSLRGLDSGQRNELLSLFPELGSAPGRDAYTAARASLKADQARLLMSA